MLVEAQARLDDHFSSLRSERAGLDYPLYALEHGIDPEEIAELREALSCDLTAHREPRQRYWLVWVVVAAEIGYAFDGDEYWITFAREIRDWRRFGNRNLIRDWFKSFAAKYTGFQPSGRWAEHFSIIAWPITHAILPSDLQGQFAHHLYNLRFELSRRPGASIAEIGNFLEAQSHAGSSRFENLLEQTELTGRLVLALRDEDIQTSVAAIYPPTLSRVTADLERRQNARDWLRDARSVLRDARVRASASLLLGRDGSDRGSDSRTQIPSSIGLVARQSPSGDWTLGIAYPDINAIIQASGVKPAALDSVKVFLADRPDFGMPGRALLTISQRERAVSSFADILVKHAARLKPEIPQLSQLLADLRVRGSAPWLLRVQSDGIARQVRGNHVRAEESYLLVTQAPVADDAVQAINLKIQESRTAGVSIYLLDVPAQLSRAFLTALDHLKIGHALRTVVEPVGLVPRWDAAADATVWLVNEEPLLRLTSDTEVREFTIGVNGTEWTHIPVHRAAETIISLGRFPIGRHIVEVRGTADAAVSSRGDQRLEAEQLHIEVRAPAPWTEGVRQQAGFHVALTPPNASLAGLISGTAKFGIFGAPARSAVVEVETFNSNGHLVGRTALGHVNLPADERAIRQLLAKLAQEPISELVQSSPRVDLSVLVEELGKGSVSIRQKIDPLRWKLETTNTHKCARLVDEAGADEAVSIDRYDICAPGKRIPVSREEVLVSLPLDAPGALLTAKFDGRHYPAILSVPGTLSSLADLGVKITVGTDLDTIRAVRRLIPLYRLWKAANPLGPLAGIRKGMVLAAIDHKVATLACGQAWAGLARQAASGSTALLERLQREVGGSPGFGYRMRQANWNRPIDGLDPISAFAKWASTYQVSYDHELATFAFRLAFEPGKIKFDASDNWAAILDRLAQVPALARGAYLARLARDRQAQDFLPGRVA